MKMGHRWVLEAKTGVKYAILAKNGPKMTIFDPFKSPQLRKTNKFTLLKLLQMSLVLMFLGKDTKLAPKILLKGS